MNDDFRILVYPNPTELDKSKTNFLYWRDTNFLFIQSIINALPSQYRFYWLIPDILPDSAASWFIQDRLRTQLMGYPFEKDAHINPYNFVPAFFLNGFKDKDIDFILNFQPNQTYALKTIFGILGQRPFIFNFYSDINQADKEKSDIELKMANEKAAEHLFFKTAAAFEKFQSYAFNHGQFSDLEKKSSIIRPPANDWSGNGGNFPDVYPDKKVVALNSRFDEYSDNMRVLDAFANIYEHRQDFIVWITDENCPLEIIENIARYPYVHIESIRPEVYGSFLHNVHAAVCLNRDFESWKMSIMDCLSNDCFVATDLKTATEFYGEKMGIVGSLIQNLEIILDTPKPSLQAYAKLMVERGATLGNLDEIENLMGKVFSQSIRQLFPNNFDELVKRINRKDSVSRDWLASTLGQLKIPIDTVNARRILLSRTNIRDDTSVGYTAYHGKPDYKPLGKRYINQPLFGE